MTTRTGSPARGPHIWAGITASHARPHRGIAALAGFMAVAAYAGVVGLMTGVLDMGTLINGRLPFSSPVLGSLALLLIVALPMTAAAVAAWRGLPWADAAVVLAGLALVGWIVVEVAFIRTFSWMQPVCAVYGALLAGLGWRSARSASAPGHGS
jgi:hypothetical protein